MIPASFKDLAMVMVELFSSMVTVYSLSGRMRPKTSLPIWQTHAANTTLATKMQE